MMEGVNPHTPRHAARPPRRLGVLVGSGVVAIGLLAGALSAAAVPPAPEQAVVAEPAAPLPEAVADLPAPTVDETAASTSPCDLPAVRDALAAGNDHDVIVAAGGAASLRASVAAGDAACVPLDDPAHVWVVVNKTRPYHQATYEPTPLAMPATVKSLSGGELRADAAAALDELAAAVRAAGAGDIAMESGYRSHRTQVASYNSQLAQRGQQGADALSARPGYSEHQSGLAADIVACDGGCGSIYGLADTPQGAWLAENAWRHGFVVRYEAGHTDVTGYAPEPWHLRFIGVDLATLYHEGGFHTLEEFFGLPPAPDYAG